MSKLVCGALWQSGSLRRRFQRKPLYLSPAAHDLRRYSTIRKPSLHNFPPIRPQLTGATASGLQLFWHNHRLKFYIGSGSAAALAVIGLTGAYWMVLSGVGVVGGIAGMFWLRHKQKTRKLHRLIFPMMEAALEKRALLSSYIGDHQFAPPERMFIKEHVEKTPVGNRDMVVFVFEVRGTRGAGVAQAKWIKTISDGSACSTLQAKNAIPKPLAEIFARDKDQIQGHKDELANAVLSRHIPIPPTPEWTLVNFFVDCVDIKNVRDAHIVIVDRKEQFEYFDWETKSVKTAELEVSDSLKQRQSQHGHAM